MIRIYVRKPGEQTGRVYRGQILSDGYEGRGIRLSVCTRGRNYRRRMGHVPRDNRGALSVNSNRENLRRKNKTNAQLSGF